MAVTAQRTFACGIDLDRAVDRAIQDGEVRVRGELAEPEVGRGKPGPGRGHKTGCVATGLDRGDRSYFVRRLERALFRDTRSHAQVDRRKGEPAQWVARRVASGRAGTKFSRGGKTLPPKGRVRARGDEIAVTRRGAGKQPSRPGAGLVSGFIRF